MRSSSKISKTKSAASGEAALSRYSLTEWARQRSEVIVDAHLDAVHSQCAARYARGKLGREVGLTVEAAIQVLGLERPGAGEHPFQADTGGPAGVNFAIAYGHAGCAAADLVIRERDAAGAVKQDLIESRADAAANRAQALHPIRQRHTTLTRGAAEIGPCAIGFDAEDHHAGLPVIAERTASEAALDPE